MRNYNKPIPLGLKIVEIPIKRHNNDNYDWVKTPLVLRIAEKKSSRLKAFLASLTKLFQ